MIRSRTATESSSAGSACTTIPSLIARAAELLPAQGPIGAFVFLNTLQALEGLPFDAGLRAGAALYGANAYLPEDRYREKLAQGRIQADDLTVELSHDLRGHGEDRIADLCSRFELRRAMLLFPLREAPQEELHWFVAETDALRKFRPEAAAAVRERVIGATRHWIMRDSREGPDASPHRPGSPANPRLLLADLMERYNEQRIEQWDAATWEALTLQSLWRACQLGASQVLQPPASDVRPVRPRDAVRQACGIDSDGWVHELLVRFCAAFADQGLAPWTLPDRAQGFWRAFLTLYAQSGGSPEPWRSGLAQELARIESAGLGPLESVAESLEFLGIAEVEWEAFLRATLLALPGWAGLLHQLDVRGDRVSLPAPQGTLTEFLAVRLVLERIALSHAGRVGLQFNGPLSGLRQLAWERRPFAVGEGLEQRAFLVFQLAQLLGWSPAQLVDMSATEWAELFAEIEGFPGQERRRLFHLALERRFRERALNAVAVHARRPRHRVPLPSFQAVFCIDAREESFRRHLEELAPDTETFGAAGFFGVAMYYRGASDAHFQTLCPIVIRPRHWVVEDVAYTLEGMNRRRTQTRKVLGAASHHVHVGSRRLASGALLTAGLGVLATVPLVARVLFPRMTARVRRLMGELVETPPVTRLRLERFADAAGPDGDAVGFSLAEMVDISERMLRDIGLTEGFARLVLFVGHGSACLNNPHKSAYDCGACSGGAGGPNARALAMMLNDLRVRTALRDRDIAIPDTTRFLGGLHNTCNDTVRFLDLDLLPTSHVRDYESAQQALDEVCRRNAHERCRRFYSAPLTIDYAAAHAHVEERSEDLAQTRPEFGNASNAMCFVGRRSRVRGLFLDRRSFLVSYDPEQDDSQATILTRILGAVVPVCSGINLQYFLSYIDPTGWGCGTKLPHNITSLLGVMDGAASDLRPGLPLQGVEVHEPVRLLFVMECRPEAIEQVMAANPGVARILRNGWVQLALLDPESAEVAVYRDGQFEPFVPTIAELPRASASVEWYRGWRDHLDFARIER